MARLEIDSSFGAVRFARRVDYNAALRVIDAMQRDEGCQARTAFLWDFTRAEIALDVFQMRALAELFAERVACGSGRVRLALLVRSTDRATALILRSVFGRCFAGEVRIFEHPSAAKIWLSLKPRDDESALGSTHASA